MNHLKNFLQFINEGAWYDNKGVYLSIKNNPNRETEFLKTVDSNFKNYNEKDLSGIRIYYGLYPVEKFYNYPKKPKNETKEQRDGRLRIKRSKIAFENLMKKNIMDHLKSENFKMAEGETMEEFLKYTIGKNIDSEVNYIVRMGSSEKLVKNLADSFNKLYPNSKIIDISKIDYFSAEEAIDWEEYKKKVDSELSKDRGYDKEGNPNPPRSRTRDQVQDWIRRINLIIAKKIENGETGSFNIRSSGIKGGIRSALKPKYNTASEDFINAVQHCVFGDSDGNLGKMIIVDDNVNQGIDFRDISNKILEILAGIIDLTKNVTTESLKSSGVLDLIKNKYDKLRIENQIGKELEDLLKIDAPLNIKNNIMGYVLYGFQTQREESTYEEYLDLIGDIARSVLVSSNIEGGTNTIYRSSYNQISDEVERIALEEIKNISPDTEREILSKIRSIISSNNDIITRGRRIVPDPTNIKYPNTSHWKVGDILTSPISGDKARIVDINHFEGFVRFEVLDGNFRGKIVGFDLGKLDPQSEKSPWKLMN
jgi:hypothetical protein